jgi:cell division protein FtsA
VLVGIDAGPTKVTTLIGEVGRSGDVDIIGYGIAPSVGMKKGMVANIDQTVQSIANSLEKAERLSGYKISSAFVSVGGSHISSQNSRGVVAVSGHKREVGREDVARATEAAKAVQTPSNRETLHVIPRGYIVDGQEGIKDPLGMSAVRLEVETHIVSGAATSVQNLTKCIANASVQIDELVIGALASAEATLTDTEKELGVVVADIGGGTTDFTLIAVTEANGELALNRVAVGEHILLGGDNIDLALAGVVAQRLAEKGTRIDSRQHQTLWANCRIAKEKLLDPESKAKEHPVTILGKGSGLVGGTIKASLLRTDVAQVLSEGFLPEVASTETPARQRRVGLQELGLQEQLLDTINTTIDEQLSHLGENAVGVGRGTGPPAGQQRAGDTRRPERRALPGAAPARDGP